MKLLIISGTPKKDGLTHDLAQAAYNAAKSQDAQAEIIQLVNLSACRMCGDGWGICGSQYTCKYGNEDGFNDFHKKMRWADGFVFITPVYWGEVSEGMKIFIDKVRRCEGIKQWRKDAPEPSYLKGKSSILVASAGGGGGGIISTFEQMQQAIAHMGGSTYPYSQYGFFDYIAVNPWNKEYKKETLAQAVIALIKRNNGQSADAK